MLPQVRTDSPSANENRYRHHAGKAPVRGLSTFWTLTAPKETPWERERFERLLNASDSRLDSVLETTSPSPEGPEIGTAPPCNNAALA